MLRVAALGLALLLAGCSDGGPRADDGLAATPSQTGGPASNRSAPPPVATVHTVAWDGAVAAGAWVCEGVVLGECRAAPSDAAFGVDHVVDGLAGNVSGELTLAWTPANAVTDQLVLDAAVLTPGCEDCPFTQVGHAAGFSPLAVNLDDIALPPGAVLRLSVYVDKYVEAPLATVGGSGDQPFTVSGDLQAVA